jgi:hypothetical protein
MYMFFLRNKIYIIMGGPDSPHYIMSHKNHTKLNPSPHTQPKETLKTCIILSWDTYSNPKHLETRYQTGEIRSQETKR